MLKTILFFAFLFPSFLHAQNKWKIGIAISPDICYRNINYENNDSKKYYNSVNTDHARFGYSGSLSTIYRFSENLELELGASYSRQLMFRKTFETFFHFPSVSYQTLLLHTDYLMIPLKVNYVTSRKFGFVGSLGISFGTTLKVKTEMTNYDSNDNEGDHNVFNDTYIYPNFVMNIDAGAGIHYSVNKFEFRAIPTGRFAFNSDTHYKDKFLPFTVGMNCSAYYSF